MFWRKVFHSAVDQRLGGRGGEGIVMVAFGCCLLVLYGLDGRDGIKVDVEPENDCTEAWDGLGAVVDCSGGSWKRTCCFMWLSLAVGETLRLENENMLVVLVVSLLR